MEVAAWFSWLQWTQSAEYMQGAVQNPSWTIVAIVAIISISLAAVGVGGTVALRRIGGNAFVSGSNPKAPDAFSAFFLQAARIAIVGVIVLATVVLALMGKLTEGAIGILSGVAGYVLGGVRPSARSTETRDTQSD